MGLNKIVQGFNQSTDFLNDSLKPLFSSFHEAWGYLHDSPKIENVIFRELDKPYVEKWQIQIILHIPNYQLEWAELFYLFPWPPEVISVAIHPHQVYNRKLPRIYLFGPETIKFNLSDRQFHCTVDSFLQPCIATCHQMYQDIYDLIRQGVSTETISLFGIGDDTMNIAHYLGEPSYHLLHCDATMSVGLTQTGGLSQGTLSITEMSTWITADQARRRLLLITPGRKGLSQEELNLITKHDFQYIFYISCIPKTAATDFTKVNIDNKYIIKTIKQYQMYNEKLLLGKKEYLETVQVWSKITNYSLGQDCCIQYHLDQNKLFAPYSPFSWSKSSNFQTIVEQFKDKFEGLTKRESWSVKHISEKHFYQPKPGQDRMLVYQNKGLDFPHDIRLEHQSSDFERFLNKLKRRCIRMLTLNPLNYVRFFYYTNKPQQINDDGITEILPFCDELIVITPQPSKLVVIRGPKIKVIQDIWTDQHHSWKREGLFL